MASQKVEETLCGDSLRDSRPALSVLKRKGLPGNKAVSRHLTENYDEPKNGSPDAIKLSIVVASIGFENKNPWP